MKKNIMMRLASFLLVAVLISTSAISGTYAKYVTADDASDNARVARWGVEFVVEDDGLFTTQYKYKEATGIEGVVYSVESKAGGDVVAPGTSGNAYSFYTTGDPEVSYKVTFNADEADMKTIYLLKDEEGNSVEYYPVVFTLTIAGENVTIADQQVTSIVNAIEGCSYFYDVDTETYYYRTSGTGVWTKYVGVGAPSINLSWNWDFDDNGNGTYDVLDTILGNLAYGYTYDKIGTADYSLEVNVDVTATAAQID